jgi:hypothetical protein
MFAVLALLNVLFNINLLFNLLIGSYQILLPSVLLECYVSCKREVLSDMSYTLCIYDVVLSVIATILRILNSMESLNEHPLRLFKISTTLFFTRPRNMNR